jgi:hypothetical protein
MVDVRNADASDHTAAASGVDNVDSECSCAANCTLTTLGVVNVDLDAGAATRST